MAAGDTPGHGGPLRVAVVGVGSFGADHLTAYQANPRCTVAAVVDADARVAQAVAEARQVPRWYTSTEDLLAGDPVDAVSIVTPARHHLHGAELALGAGIPVLLEKPLTLSTSDADRLADAATRSPAFVMPAHLLRFSPAYGELRRRLAAGAVGQVLAIAFRRHRGRDHMARFADVHPAFMTLVHDIDLAIWIGGGAPGTLDHTTQARAPGDPQPAVVWATATSRSGIVWSFRTAWTLDPGQHLPDTLEVAGSAGMLEVSIGGPPTADDDPWRIGARSDDLERALVREIDHFLDCVTHNEPSALVPMAESVAGIALAEAIVSDDEGRTR